MITITIRTENAAFEENNRRDEIARILRRLANEIDAGARLPENLRDINGNHVGNLIATGKDRSL